MRETVISSREFNQDVAGAKRAARTGPVVITDRGNPAFVLTTYKSHRRAEERKFVSLLDALAMPEDNFEIDLPGAQYPRPIDLS